MSERKTAGPKVKCIKCGSVIQSMHRHDFKWCPCNTIAVDGGSDYLRLLGGLDSYEIVSEEEPELACEPLGSAVDQRL